MPDKITFYAVVDRATTVENPYGLVRRLKYGDGGFDDETIRRDFSWEFTPAIVEWEHGDLDYELVEISSEQAHRIIEGYFREKWGTFGQPLDS